MIDKSYEIAGFHVPPARALAASLAALIILGGTAAAGEVTFPKDKPKVAMDVPDDWTVDTTAAGLELRSPEKNSIIVAQVMTRKKGLVEAWTKDAAERLKAFGVSFDKNINPAPAPAPTPKVASIGGTPPVPNAPDGSAKTPDAFTFSGAPSIETPGSTGSNQPIDAGQFSVEALTGFDGKIKKEPKLHFKTVEYVGTTMNGKHVDTELAIYTLSDDRVFLLMQESESTDNRSVKIAQTIRGINTGKK